MKIARALAFLFALVSPALAQPIPPPSPWTYAAPILYPPAGSCILMPQSVAGGCPGGGNAINVSGGFYVSGVAVSPSRTKLSGPITFYVNGSSGNDSNFPCTSSGSPCLTKAGVVSGLQKGYDLGGQTVTVNVTGDSSSLLISGPFPGDNLGGSPLVTFIGDPSLAITNCTNATPIVVTAAGHTYVNGDHVIISGVVGNLNCNGAFVVASSNQGAGTFALTNENGGGNIAGSGPYSSGGTVQAPYRQVINNGANPAIKLELGAQANFSGFALNTTGGVNSITFYCNTGSRCFITGKMDFQGNGISLTSNKGSYLEIDDSFSIDVPSGGNFVHEPHGGVLFMVAPAFYLRANCSYPNGGNVNAAFIMVTDADVSWTPSVTSYGFTCTSTLQWLVRDKGSIQINPSGFGGGQTPPTDGYFPGDTVGQYQTSISQNASPIAGPGYYFTNAQMTVWGGNTAAGTLNLYSTSNATPSGDSVRMWAGAVNWFTLLGNGNVGWNDTNPAFAFVMNAKGTAGLSPAGTSGLYNQIKFGNDTAWTEASVSWAGQGVTAYLRADGSSGSPTAVQSGELIQCSSWAGWTSSATFSGNKARVCGVATDNFTSSTQGTGIEFDTTAAGGTTRAQAMRAMAGVFVGSSTSPTDRGAGVLEVATGLYAAGTQGVTCPTGSPSASFATVGGVVTHC